MRDVVWSRWFQWKFLAMGILAFSMGCSSSGSSGCSCAKPIPGGFPVSETVKNVAQVKLTKNGVDFIQNNNSLLIKQFLPQGLEFDVPPTKSSNAEICRNPPCKIVGNIRKMNLGLVPSNKLRAEMWLDIKTQRDMEIRVKQKIGFITIRKTCKVSLRVSNKKISTDITFGLHPANDHLTFAIGNPSFSISNSDFKIKGDVICKLVDLLKGLFKGLIEKEAKKALGDAIGDVTCKTCKKSSECGFGATCSGGKCMKGGSCLPLPLGTEGAMDVSTLLSGFGNKQSGDMLFSAFMGGRAQVKTDGIELGMLGGTTAKNNPCVTPRQFSKLPAPPILAFPKLSPDGKSYMVGIGISDIMMKSAARDLYRSGALCLRIDSSLSSQLGSVFTAQGIGTLFPSLSTLVGNDNPPLYIALRPSVPPEIDIGKGTVTKDAKGNTVIKDPLIEFNIPKLNFDFMMRLHDRWVRLFTFQADVSLPLALTVKPGNKLGLVMGELGSALKNPTVKHSYMLSEKPSAIATTLFSTLKAIIPLAAGSLGNQEFALPELQGFKLTIRGMTGITPRKDKPNRFQFLALFADLGLAPPSKPLMPEVSIGMRLETIHTPPHLHRDLKMHRKIETFPSVVVQLDDYRSDRAYAFRINGGIWGPYQEGSRHVLESAQFLFDGNHKIEVRSRSALRPSEEDFGTGDLTVRIDHTAPTLTLKRDARGVLARAKDNLSPNDELRLEVQVNSQGWNALAAGEWFSLRSLPYGATVQIRATDQDGNARVETINIYNPSPSIATTPGVQARPKVAKAYPPTPGQRQVLPAQPKNQTKATGCSQLNGQGGLHSLWVLALGLLVLAWRRRMSALVGAQ